MTTMARTTAGMLVLPVLLASLAPAAAGTLGGPLELEDKGSFFIGGRPANSSHLGSGPAGPTPPARSWSARCTCSSWSPGPCGDLP